MPLHNEVTSSKKCVRDNPPHNLAHEGWQHPDKGCPLQVRKLHLQCLLIVKHLQAALIFIISWQLLLRASSS
jgi:hypothetical protein